MTIDDLESIASTTTTNTQDQFEIVDFSETSSIAASATTTATALATAPDRSSKKSDYSRNDVLICATHGRLYALHKIDGSRLWKADFPTGAFGGAISLFVTEQDRLIADANGKTACLNILTGDTIWVNKMPGFGTDEVAIVSSSTRAALEKKKKNDNDDHSGTISSETVSSPSSSDFVDDRKVDSQLLVFAGSRGKVVAINSETGDVLWTYNCPGGYYKTPVIIVEPADSLSGSHPYQVLYVGAGNWVYCLKAQTGGVLWSVKVSNIKTGISYTTLATTWSSRNAVESHSSFNQSPFYT